MSNPKSAPHTHAPSQSLLAKELRKFPLLTKEEEVTLGKAALGGCQEARNKLVEHNIRLVYHIAKRLPEVPGQTSEDKIADGMLGLIRAAEKFDPSKGFRFSTYASWWVKQAIRRGKRKYPLIMMPSRENDLLSQIGHAERRLRIDQEDEPTPEQVAEEIDAPVRAVRLVMNTRRATAWSSLSVTIGEGDGGTLADIVQQFVEVDPEDEKAERVLAELVLEAKDHDSILWEVIFNTARLTEREVDILTLRYGLDGGDGCTLQEVGEHYGITRERIRQLQVTALNKLRLTFRKMNLKLGDVL